MPSLLSVAALITIFPLTTGASGTDVVQVTNGDRFTGDVTRLEHGHLYFRTDAAGTISIAWGQVVRITSSQQLDVETASGVRYSGSVASPVDGSLVVRTDSGTTAPLDLSEVVRITPIELGFRERTSGSIDLGANFHTAENTTNYALDAAARYRSRSYESEVSFTSWLSRRDDAHRTTQNDLIIDVRRFLPRRWFAIATFQGQQDDELELDRRVLIGGGAGRRLVQSNQTSLSAHGGLNYDAERYSGASTDHSAELFAGADWDWFPADGATEASVVGTTYASLARARVRVELDAQVSRSLFWELYWAIHALESFDSNPPPGDRRHSAFGVSGTLGWKF